MLKAILLSVAIFFIALLLEASIGISWNMAGIGTLFAVVSIGGFLLYAIEKKR